MRKLLFLTMIALLSAGTLSAQSRALRDARRALQNNELGEARTLIRQAAEHPETANDPNTWRIKGDIGNRAFDNEMTRLMLGQPANDRAMHDGLFESFAPYVKADSLGQLVLDRRGRVSNPVRRDIASILRANHQHFINGGLFFNEIGEFSRATDFFEIFWNIPSLPMFEDAGDVFVLDSTFQAIKYYAVITALQAEDRPRAIAMLHRINSEPFIENNVFSGSDVFELLAVTYLDMGDSVRFMETVRAGATRFPNNEFLVNNMINDFIMRGETQRAMEYIDIAIANNPASACDLISVRGALLAEQGDTEGAEAEFRRALGIDPNCERALEALARSYIVRAQDLREETFTMSRAEQVAYDRQILELFQHSLPLLETLERIQRGRSAPEHEFRNVLMLLRNVYYNLSMLSIDKTAQLEAVERELGLYDD